MRILFLASKDIRNPLAGGGTFEYFRLASKLSKCGNQVSILCGGFGGAHKQETIENIQINRVGGAWSVYLLSLFVLLLRSDLRTQDKIVNVEENGIPFPAPYLLRIPSLIICWHLPRETFFVELMDQYGRLLGFLLASVLCFYEDFVSPRIFKSITIFTFSECSARDLSSVGFMDVRMHEFALAKGIMLLSDTLTELPLQNGSSSNAAKGGPQLIIVGRLTKYKGIQDIIRVIPLLLKDFPDLRLIIVGRGNYESKLIQLIKDLKLETRAIIAGYVPVDEKMRLYSQSQLNLVPSYKEGFPTPLIESAFVGIPTLVPNRIGLKEFVIDDETGFLYSCDGFLHPSPNSSNLARKIVSILNHEDRRREVGLAAKKIYTGINIDDNETKFFEDFTNVLSGAQG